MRPETLVLFQYGPLRNPRRRGGFCLSGSVSTETPSFVEVAPERLAYGRLASSDPWDCGIAGCGICHCSAKKNRRRSSRDERDCRRELDCARRRALRTVAVSAVFAHRRLEARELHAPGPLLHPDPG